MPSSCPNDQKTKISLHAYELELIITENKIAEISIAQVHLRKNVFVVFRKLGCRLEKGASHLNSFALRSWQLSYLIRHAHRGRRGLCGRRFNY